MARLRRCLLGLVLLLPALVGAAPAQITLATWNLEWLVSLQTAKDAVQHCRSGEHAALPCDVALGRARSATDFAVLARYARQLDADVVALQEVEDARTAAQLFSGYDFCFSRRRQPQNVGFAIRKGLPHQCAADLEALSLHDSVRRGVQVVLFPGGPRETWLLSIHLKSGCARESLDASQPACRILARQGPVLGAWIDAQVAAGHRYAVLGDFNRNLLGELRREPAGDSRPTDAPAATRGLWPQLSDGHPADERLVNTAAGQPFSNCHVGQTFNSYIDYILLGGGLATYWQPATIQHHGYKSLDARRYVLSDHCPVSLTLRLP